MSAIIPHDAFPHAAIAEEGTIDVSDRDAALKEAFRSVADAAPLDGPPLDGPPLNGPHGEGHTVLTGRVQAAFLENLQHFGNVRLACKTACISAQTAYRGRRRSAAFARAWDAALLAARCVAEATLADRAIHGVEEAVFYHGEEIARRRRYDSRLLLAHLARLDRLEEREEVAAMLPELDDCIDALRAGETLEERAERVAQEAAESSQDRVPPVPSCRECACERCGGQCETPGAVLTSADCMWLGNRLERMDAARPHDALLPHKLACGGQSGGDVEHLQLLAFEGGVAEWWLIANEAMLEAALLELGDGAQADGDADAVEGGSGDEQFELDPGVPPADEPDTLGGGAAEIDGAPA